MPLEKAPFQSYSDPDEEKDEDRETFTVSINKKERLKLDKIRKTFDMKSDSRALKEAAWIGINVLHSTFGERFLRYLFKKERSRLSDYKDFEQ